ncbi:MAG: RluA family pseudouridine synthase [Planctomycetota bacterium]
MSKGIPPEPGDNDQYIQNGGKVDPEAIRGAIRDAEEGGDPDEDGLRRVVFRLSRDLNKRLDKYLTDRITFMSRAQLQRLIDLEGVTVNGRTPKCSTRLRQGDVVEVVVPPPPSKEIQPDPIPLNILEENEHFMVLNKQADLIVHPARSHNRGTLVNGLVHHFNTTRCGALSSVGEEHARPGVIHRLDRDTTGVMVIAKDDEAHWKLGRQFENRTTDKRYLAVCEGVLERDTDIIDLPLGNSPSRVKGQREKQAVRFDEFGKPSITVYRVRERYELPDALRASRHPLCGYTLVELELRTGRTHQIRVHMAASGHPLIGDDMYGGPLLDLAHLTGKNSDTDVRAMHRQALHAAMLGFRHPHTGEGLVFQAPLPDDFRVLIAMLRAHRDASGVRSPAGCVVDIDRMLSV